MKIELVRGAKCPCLELTAGENYFSVYPYYKVTIDCFSSKP